MRFCFFNDTTTPEIDTVLTHSFPTRRSSDQLTPLLEKVAADYANRGVILVKVDVDENKMIAAQFRVQSVPTVYAISQAQIVADLTPARTEAQPTRALDQLLTPLPIQGAAQHAETEIDPRTATGEEVPAGGDGDRATSSSLTLLRRGPGTT